MKERPIIFSGPMVRALLDGSKTQTRRVVKPIGAHHIFQFRGEEAAHGADEPTGEWAWCRAERVVSEHIRCPYGKPGDRLWVRETFAHMYRGNAAPEARCDDDVAYKADGFTPDEYAYGSWKPPIHMPRWASRITLEVTGVHVERLQDISEADALAEGIEVGPSGFHVDGGRHFHAASARESYASLWDSLNAARGFGWDVNPWVWVVQFRRLP